MVTEAPEGRGEIELLALEDYRGRTTTHLLDEGVEELLDEGHHLLIIGVGLIELEHRELGVVCRRDPLIPKVLPDLIDSLEIGRASCRDRSESSVEGGVKH